MEYQLLSLQKVLCEFEILPGREVVSGDLTDSLSSSSTSSLASNSPDEDSADCTSQPLILQGQLRYLDDWDAMIFLCNPL